MGENMTSKATFSIIGGGAVGKAIKNYYREVKVFDKYVPADPIQEAAAADYIFVAVPTPFNNGQDLTEMDDAIANVVNHLLNPDHQIIIIKSTVLPGTTENYQKKYPDARFVFNPEFLTEKTAAEDYAKPDKQIVGYTSTTAGIGEEALKILPDAPYKKLMPAVDAEMT